MQHADSDRIEYDSLEDLGSALYENKVNTFETTTSAVILEQIYDLINGSYDVNDHSLGEITRFGPIETFHIVLTFSQSENVAWTTTIGIYWSGDVSYKYAYIIDVGRGEPHNIGEEYTGEGEIQFVSIPRESELYDWISQAYQSQAYKDYCAIENLREQ